MDSTVNRAHQHGTTLTRASHGTGGLVESTRICASEPPDHAIGRSRGGLSTKIHQLVRRQGPPAGARCSDRGRAATRRCSPHLLHALRVPRLGPGRPRTRPDAVLGDKAYSSRGNRGAAAPPRASRPSSPNPPTRSATANAAASSGGRPPAFDAEAYKGRNVVERSLQRPQAVARPGHPLRQARPDLPRRRRPARHHHLATRIRRHALAATPPSIYGGSARPVSASGHQPNHTPPSNCVASDEPASGHVARTRGHQLASAGREGSGGPAPLTSGRRRYASAALDVNPGWHRPSRGPAESALEPSIPRRRLTRPARRSRWRTGWPDGWAHGRRSRPGFRGASSAVPRTTL